MVKTGNKAIKIKSCLKFSKFYTINLMEFVIEKRKLRTGQEILEMEDGRETLHVLSLQSLRCQCISVAGTPVSSQTTD